CAIAAQVTKIEIRRSGIIFIEYLPSSFIARVSSRCIDGGLVGPVIGSRPLHEGIDAVGMRHKPVPNTRQVCTLINEVNEWLYVSVLLHLHDVGDVVLPEKGVFVVAGRDHGI